MHDNFISGASPRQCSLGMTRWCRGRTIARWRCGSCATWDPPWPRSAPIRLWIAWPYRRRASSASRTTTATSVCSTWTGSGWRDCPAPRDSATDAWCLRWRGPTNRTRVRISSPAASIGACWAGMCVCRGRTSEPGVDFKFPYRCFVFISIVFMTIFHDQYYYYILYYQLCE